MDLCRKARLDLLEVMCYSDCEMVKQAQNLGARAQQFSLLQGDLRQASARHKLALSIMLHRPKNLWYSPDCGPWSMWNFLHSQKSLELDEKITQKHFESIWQIALGVCLYRLQVDQGSHFHWEQPSGSEMLKFPALEELHNLCRPCRFDLCRMGH